MIRRWLDRFFVWLWKDEIRPNEPCRRCRGHGFNYLAGGRRETCPTCVGTGDVCDGCAGLGEIAVGLHCPTCGGTGQC